MTLIPATVGTSTLIGRRTSNQDRAWAHPPWVFMLDGVGGSRDGGAAAQIALGSLLQEAGLIGSFFLTQEEQRAAVIHLVEKAHTAVMEFLGQSSGVASGSSTLSLVHVQPRSEQFAELCVAAVGDSPVWAGRLGSSPILLTSTTEGRYSKHLDGALGWASHTPQVHTVTLPLPSRIVAASDGLAGLTSSERARIIMASPDPQQCATMLTRATLSQSRDNVTVAVLDIGTDTDTPSEGLQVRSTDGYHPVSRRSTKDR